jgi:hypothetical protein
MMMRAMMKMMMKKIASMNVRNSLMIDRRSIEIFEPMFDLLRFENNEIREFADLMKTEKIETEHLKLSRLRMNVCLEFNFDDRPFFVRDDLALIDSDVSDLHYFMFSLSNV